MQARSFPADAANHQGEQQESFLSFAREWSYLLACHNAGVCTVGPVQLIIVPFGATLSHLEDAQRCISTPFQTWLSGHIEADHHVSGIGFEAFLVMKKIPCAL